ncbi:MAG: hypothetical protein ACOYL3_07175 [Desulfuromonadaceae bacterium]
MKCFFHVRDMDGRCSGAIVKLRFPDVELIPFDYNWPFPWNTIEEDELVYMVDVSLPLADMVRLRGMCRLIWIDHHKGIIQESRAADEYFNGLQYYTGENYKLSGCELTWRYLHDSSSIMPLPVYLLGRYDVWIHDDPRVLPFQSGMWAINGTGPECTVFWSLLFGDEDLVEEVIEKGELLLAAKTKDNAAYVRSFGFDTEFESLRALAVNRGSTNSKIFDGHYDPKRHDVMITFVWERDHWKCSVYVDKGKQNDVDASVLAKRHGGGGHLGAAGFSCAQLPFVLPVAA